jgi:hypothetical protein
VDEFRATVGIARESASRDTTFDIGTDIPMTKFLASLSFAALTLAAGTSLASAADLGGNCCADLEERVAELEATTVRKGNRKVSIEVSGQVNKALMYWNDGKRSNTFLGLENSTSPSRFQLAGEAKISSRWKAGFVFAAELNGNQGDSTSQLDEDGDGTIGGSRDHRIVAVDVNWWLENDRVGRVTVGRLTGSGPQLTIDIGGASVVAPGTFDNGRSIATRLSTGGALAGPLSLFWFTNDQIRLRQDGFRYDSPTWSGFSFSASAGEAMKVERRTIDSVNNNIGRILAADLKYANEFNGVKVAAAFGASWARAEEVFEQDPAAPNDVTRRGGSLSLMHMATGLFLQGHMTRSQDTLFDPVANVRFAGATQTMTHVQAGIARNWFGPGNTVLYAEGARSRGRTLIDGLAGTGLALNSNFYGLGVVQNIDAAAMELFVGYRRIDGEFVNLDPAGNDTFGFNKIDLITAGARIKF